MSIAKFLGCWLCTFVRADTQLQQHNDLPRDSLYLQCQQTYEHCSQKEGYVTVGNLVSAEFILLLLVAVIACQGLL